MVNMSSSLFDVREEFIKVGESLSGINPIESPTSIDYNFRISHFVQGDRIYIVKLYYFFGLLYYFFVYF